LPCGHCHLSGGRCRGIQGDKLARAVLGQMQRLVERQGFGGASFGDAAA
jgi:hypothetical protein